MNIFQEIKTFVSAGKAAEQYGIKINRNKMACCPFLDDRHPSMKIDQNYFCFACGAKGDVIDFTARLFGISQFDAARKLIGGFALPIKLAKHKHTQQKFTYRQPSMAPRRYPFSLSSKLTPWIIYAV